MSNIVVSQATKLASRFGVEGEPEELVSVLKATAFKGPVSDAQMAALLMVASQYGLNPFIKEIYAFPDKNNGIVPVVGVDGWSRIINNHPQFDGMEFHQDDNTCTCIIYRKDRSHPTSATEYIDECKRPTSPWQSHPRRMLRHKSLIQTARLAFGYTGIYDQDEAERIAEIEVNPMRQSGILAAEAARIVPNDVNQEERKQLIADLELVAEEGGIEKYADTWKKLTAKQRKMIGISEHERLKNIASSINVSTDPVEEIQGEEEVNV